MKDGGKGAFRAGTGDYCVEQLRCFACAENQEKQNSTCKGDRLCSSDESEGLDWMFIAIELNSEI